MELFFVLRGSNDVYNDLFRMKVAKNKHPNFWTKFRNSDHCAALLWQLLCVGAGVCSAFSMAAISPKFVR